MTETRGPGRPSKRSRRRRPIGVHGRARQKLSVPEIPGYICRWVNDEDTRLHEKLVNDDYDYVERGEVGDHVGENVDDGNSDLGTKVRVLVGQTERGPLYAYLLKKKKEFYDEDLREAEEERKAKEATLKRGTGEGGQTLENQYGSIRNA